MIKSDKANITISGTAPQLAAELAGAVKHVILTITKEDKIAGVAAFRTVGDVLCDTAEKMVKDHKVKLEWLNDDLDDDDEKIRIDKIDEDALKAFLDTLPEEDMDKLLDIINKFDEFTDEEDD